jgi:uncharacterized Zn finger protein (UPF0148 family)
VTCPHCGRYGEPDPETGYDGDSICPTCAAERDDAAADVDVDRRREEREDDRDDHLFD